MKRRPDDRLFELDLLGPKRLKVVGHKRHLQLADDPSAQLPLEPDKDGLIHVSSDGLPLRQVKTHSRRKAELVSSDIGTVTRAMRYKWFSLAYLELFCGPGRLIDADSGEELPGSPFQALDIEIPFSQYVFSDASPQCTSALKQRLNQRRADGQQLPVPQVRTGDANDPAHLEHLCSLIDPKALVIAYLDPAQPNLHWSTIEFLANKFKAIDFIINLPFSGIHRSISAGGVANPALMLNHPNPIELLNETEGHPADNIRRHYELQLRNLGLVHTARRCVNTHRTNSPLYDIVLASRHDMAVKLFEKANPRRVAQTSIFDLLPDSASA